MRKTKLAFTIYADFDSTLVPKIMESTTQQVLMINLASLLSHI